MDSGDDRYSTAGVGLDWTLIPGPASALIDKLVFDFRHRLPLEYLVEPRLGKPYALNTALEHISGDLVVFTDDDVLPDPDWLVMWRSAADRCPEYSIFGGTIDLLFDRDRPGWLSGVQGWGESVLFASTEPLAEGPIPPDGRNIYGGNMAIRTSALLNGPGYDERFFVGPLGLMGEETELVQRLGAGGHKACFIPGPRVRHIVQPYQLSWTWALRRAYRFGKRYWVLDLRDRLRLLVAEIFHMPRYLVRRVAELAVGTPIALLSRDERRIFDHLWRLAFHLGIVVQARALYQGRLAECRAAGPSLGADPHERAALIDELRC